MKSISPKIYINGMGALTCPSENRQPYHRPSQCRNQNPNSYPFYSQNTCPAIEILSKILQELRNLQTEPIKFYSEIVILNNLERENVENFPSRRATNSSLPALMMFRQMKSMSSSESFFTVVCIYFKNKFKDKNIF